MSSSTDNNSNNNKGGEQDLWEFLDEFTKVPQGVKDALKLQEKHLKTRNDRRETGKGKLGKKGRREGKERGCCLQS